MEVRASVKEEEKQKREVKRRLDYDGRDGGRGKMREEMTSCWERLEE